MRPTRVPEASVEASGRPAETRTQATAANVRGRLTAGSWRRRSRRGDATRPRSDGLRRRRSGDVSLRETAVAAAIVRTVFRGGAVRFLPFSVGKGRWENHIVVIVTPS